MEEFVDHDAEAELDEPLLENSEQRKPWEPLRKDTMYTKLKLYRRLQQDWVRVSPAKKAARHPSVYPPVHVLPPAGNIKLEIR
jgi:hypothetical protein